MKALEGKIENYMQEFKPFDFPGGKIRAYSKGRKIVHMDYGKTWPIYDVASLTKIVFSASLVMQLVHKKVLSVDEDVKTYLPWHPYPKLKIKQLLAHCAGYVWWYPFYKYLDQDLSPEERFGQMQREIRKQKIKAKAKPVYSDVDLFILAAVFEKIFAKPLIEIWREYHEQTLPRSQFHFCYNNKPAQPLKNYAPTEKCPWRKKLIHGEVHDENAWSIGGVSANAGLFGRIDDICDWGLALRKDLRGESEKIAPSGVIKKFIKNQNASWGLGFMKPSGASTSGSYFSKESFGHTGFTGMSLWMEPKRDLLVVMASNRVNPTRKNQDFKIMRPKIHDIIVDHLRGH